jgi:type I restriction enzyme R subunit
MIADRDDLQTSRANYFSRSRIFLSLGAAKIIADREDLKTELSIRELRILYLYNPKFCEAIGELNTVKHIICFSDEAHRSQVRLNTQLKVWIKKAASEGKAETPITFVTKPYAEHLRSAFPNATFVGFTGTLSKKLFKSLVRWWIAIRCNNLLKTKSRLN